LFVTEIAFDDEALINEAKVGVLAGSLLAGVIGALVLRYFGERLPLCSPNEAQGGPPPLPEGVWRAPAGRGPGPGARRAAPAGQAGRHHVAVGGQPAGGA